MNRVGSPPGWRFAVRAGLAAFGAVTMWLLLSLIVGHTFALYLTWSVLVLWALSIILRAKRHRRP